MKTSIVALMVLISSAPAFASLTPASVKGFSGKYSYEVTKNPEMQKLISSTLLQTLAIRSSSAVQKAVLQDFDNSMSVSSIATLLDGEFLVLSGCEAHNCGDGNRALIVIDANKPSALVIIRKNTNIVGNDFQEGRAVISSPDWITTFGTDFSRLPSDVQTEISDR